LVTRASSFQPDGIIVSICLNDIHVYGEQHKRKAPRTLTERLRTFAMLLARHSELFLASYLHVKSALYRFGVLDINRLQGAELLTLEPPSRRQEAAWQSSLQMLAEIVDSAKRKKIPLLLVVFPLEIQLSQQKVQEYRDKFRIRVDAEVLQGQPQERLREFALQYGVSFLDLLPAFREHDGATLYLRNISVTYDPVHPSETGNRVAADEILRFLERTQPHWLPENALLPDRSRPLLSCNH
jgi:lysophospholipase L1-like esterase